MAQATPLPWKDGQIMVPVDVSFAFHAVNALPELIATLREAREALETEGDILKAFREMVVLDKLRALEGE